MSSIPEDLKPPEGSTSEFFFFVYSCFLTIYTAYTNVNYIHMYKGNLLYVPVSDGSVVQPPPVPYERALSRPMPHPSDRTV